MQRHWWRLPLLVVSCSMYYVSNDVFTYLYIRKISLLDMQQYLYIYY
jgi:hypothetical protein